MNNVFTGKFWSIDRFVSGFSNNAFLITCARTRSSVIIDTPADPHELISAARGTNVETILITHGHRDHVEGYEEVIAVFSSPTGIGSGDRESLPSSAKATIDVTTNESILIGDIALRALHTPGHTPGSTCFVLESEGSLASGELSHVFTGDTLFPGGPGRSKSHDALKQMISSLGSHIFVLHETTVVLPGHGEFTTIGNSKREYIAFASKPLNPTLSGDVTWA
jgi:glyoxylase-like metal-dependent hydrolase (beta-lactamase superfamily II)